MGCGAPPLPPSWRNVQPCPAIRPPACLILRDCLAVAVVAMFMFPLFWWGLTSIKPAHAIFENFSVNWFDFTPTFSILSGDAAG